MQNTGAGLHTAFSEFCDGAVDGVCTARWPKDNNKCNIICVVTVIGVATFRD